MNSSIILFEDNHLFILNKKAGLLTQPNESHEESLEQQAKNWIKDIYHKKGNVFLEPAHRLDKPVSGIVLFAKTSKALSRIHADIRQKEVKKIYWAWVEGILNNDHDSLEHFMMHDHFQARIVPKNHSQAKVCRLEYCVKLKDTDSQSTLIEINLETGRYHQIRLQFSSIGHPIVGDQKYGSKCSYIPNCIALHHKQLTVNHPITKTHLVVEAPLPTNFAHHLNL